MKRKLFSTLLCAFALLLLMGAGTESDGSDAPAIEEESTSSAQSEQVLETRISTGSEQSGQTAGQSEADGQPAAEDADAQVQPAPETDPQFLIDGQPAPLETCRTLKNGVTYVALAPTLKAILPDAQITWDGGTQTVTVQTASLSLTAKVGQLYVVANGRYLYIQDGVQMENNRVIVPLRIVTEAVDAQLGWDGATSTVLVTRGSGALTCAEQFYADDELFWLSRIIYAESGNQPLKGQMAVGNTIFNRVANPAFPNTILGVISQKNQFSTYRGGKLADRTPNESSVIAAKLVLDGGVVEETKGALYFDSQVASWASRQRTYLATIGGHKFYL